jgi:hypothetical protein
VHRHIARCATCTARRAVELRSARLLDLSPGAALAAGAAESSRATPRTPLALKAHTIALATGRSTVAAAYSIDVLGRVGSFGKQGFPKPARARRGRLADRRCAHRPRAPRPFPPRQATAATGVVVAVTAAAVAYAFTGTSQHFMTSAYPKRHVAAATTPAAALGDAARGDLPAPSAVQGVPVGAVPSVTLPLPTKTTTPAAGPSTTGPTAPATSDQEADAAAETGSRPENGSSGTGPASGAAVPAQGAAGHAARSTPAWPAAGRGTLSSLPDGGTLMVLPGWLGSLVALRAEGGTVQWSASVANDRDHAISVWPSSGTLTPSDPVTMLTIKASQAITCGSGGQCPTVTLSPGGTRFTIWPTGGGLSDVLDGSGPLDGGMPLPSVTSSDRLPMEHW